MSKRNQSAESSGEAWEGDEDSSTPYISRELIQLQARVQNVYADAKRLPWLSVVAFVVPIVLIALPFVVPLHIWQRRSLLKELRHMDDPDLDSWLDEPLAPRQSITVGEAVHVLETKWMGVYIACAYVTLIALMVPVAIIMIALKR